MKSNIILKIMGVLVILIIIFLVMIRSNKGDLKATNTDPKSNNGLDSDLTESLKSLGIEADTPDETLKTLIAKMSDYEKTMEESNRANEQLRKELETYKNLEDTIVSRVQSKINKRLRDSVDEIETKKGTLEGMIDDLKGLKENYIVTPTNLQPSSDIPSGIGINNGNGPSVGIGYYSDKNSYAGDDLIWIEPLSLDYGTEKGSKVNLAGASSEANGNYLPVSINSIASGTVFDQSKNKKKLTPFFTIPANATMLGSVSMSALLGRIPVDGTVTDPYPVKIMIGPENLASNGIKIPESITGIVMSGVAKGDWTLSCVSADIKSMTFTFEDGTIRTIPDPKGAKNSGGKVLGWISDKYGVPCVAGERITNAPTYLAGKIGLSAITAYGEAMAEAETTKITSAEGNTVSSVTGDPAAYAMNKILGGGSKQATDWLDKRMGQSFDVVYVEPGTEVVFHASSQLDIDYDDNGRKVNHYASAKMPSVRTHLD